MSDERALRVLFWNAWLLHPRLWPNGPKIPGLGGVVAPHLPERAEAIGKAVAGKFDVAAFSETFEPDEQDTLVAGWSGRKDVTVARGPGRRAGFFTNSGLLTVVDGLPVTRQANAPYAKSGQWWRDSDAMAQKGVLLVEVDPGEGLPHVEVYSTHLFAGGGWIPGPGHDDHLRHHAIRMAEADELVAFVERRHHDGNVVVVCGDMNVSRVDERLDGDKTERFRDLSDRFAKVGLVDAGKVPGSDTGITSDLPGGLASVPKAHPDDPDRVAADPSDPAQGPPSNTIDHIFVALDDVATPVTVGPLQRWMFPRDTGQGKPQRLSDHIAVSVELTFGR